MFSSKRVWNRFFANPVSSTECLPWAENGSPQLGSWADFLVRWSRKSRIISHLAMCVWPRRLPHVTWLRRKSPASALPPHPKPLPWTAATCRLQRTLGLSMLYCTELRHLTLTHRMSADCSFWKCHITLNPLRNDFWLFRNKIKNLLILSWAPVNWNHKYLWMEN